MRNICVLGLQWGDEGKGKIVDVLTEGCDAVIRYQGGANAGHTIVVGDDKHVLHLLPSGMLREGVQGILGNGMVVSAETLLEEVAALPTSAIDRLHLSSRAHLVLPFHCSKDRERESASAEKKIGTTLRGIGPAYEDKFARRGVRLGDLLVPGFIAKTLPERLQRRGIPAAEIVESQRVCERLVERLGHRITASERLLRALDQDGKRLLFEGAQGCLLDIDFGTYPFVTSSSPSFLGVGPGSGFSPRKIDHVVGVTKAYCTRVGEGPFPSELHGDAAEDLRRRGGEFGATTGRPRRCGWLDIPALRFAVQINDVDSLAMTKCDILQGRDKVPVAVAYRIGGQVTDEFPESAAELDGVETVCEEWPGWEESTPEAMAPFMARLSEAVGVPVSMISTGRRRDEVVLFEPFESFLKERR